jgi:hypothetical protein
MSRHCPDPWGDSRWTILLQSRKTMQATPRKCDQCSIEWVECGFFDPKKCEKVLLIVFTLLGHGGGWVSLLGKRDVGSQREGWKKGEEGTGIPLLFYRWASYLFFPFSFAVKHAAQAIALFPFEVECYRWQKQCSQFLVKSSHRRAKRD